MRLFIYLLIIIVFLLVLDSCDQESAQYRGWEYKSHVYRLTDDTTRTYYEKGDSVWLIIKFRQVKVSSKKYKITTNY